MTSLAFDRAGSGPALVLLHALGTDRKVWKPVLPRLTPHRDCITVDLPGFGESAPLDGPDFLPRALAARVRELLAELDLDGGRAHVAGNSLGGWTALELALTGDVASATAIAPAGLWGRPLPPKPEVARRLARLSRPLLRNALRSPGVRRTALYGSMAHPERMPLEDAVDLIRAYADAPGFTRVNRAMRGGTFDHLQEIAVPLTLVWPDRDALVARVPPPAHAREIRLHDCGHIPMWDDPEAVADALLIGSTAATRVPA